MKQNNSPKILEKALIISLVAGFSLLLPIKVDAATLIMQPSASQVKVNNLFTVKVMVNTQNKAVNNIESSIVFPPDLVEVVSVDIKSSIFSLWVEQPNFSNSNGVVSFNGGITNPGYTGGGGKLVSIVFKAKKEGVASIFFSGAAARENDGLGTDILSGQNSADITIGNPPSTESEKKTGEDKVDETKKQDEIKKQEEEKNKEKEDKELVGNLLGVSVSSDTHPDSSQWYPLKDARFIWKNPLHVNALQVGLSRQLGTIPSKDIEKTLEKREVPDIEDGVSYFNIRYKNDQGWSEVSSYKLQIDTQPPYDLSLISKTDESGGVRFHYSAQDDTSGIKNYEIKIDKGDTISLPFSEVNEYSLPLTLGKHAVELIAFDKAGNSSSYQTSLVLSATQAPTITFSSPSVKFGEQIYVRGQSPYANANVTVTVKSAVGIIQDYDVLSDEFGKFAFSSIPMKVAGNYEIWATVLNADGSKGPVSARVVVPVEENVTFFKKVSHFFSVITVLSGLLILVGMSSVWGWYKYFALKRKTSPHKGEEKHKKH